MANSDVASSRLEHLTFVGDCMLLLALVSGLLFSATSNIFATLGLSTGFGLLALFLAPALTLMATMALHKNPLNRRGIMIVLASSLAVILITAIAYYVVVSTGFDQAAGFGVATLMVLGFLGVVAVALLADSVHDLARARAHRALDVMRLVILAVVLALLALFSQSPDFGVALVALAGLGLAGAATGLVGDALLMFGNRRRTNSGTGGPAIAP